MKSTKVIFFGTPWIAKECLDELYNLDLNIVAVISQPDKEYNRNKKIIYSEVKNYCLEKNIKILQPEKLSTIKDELIALKPDIFITCAYGQFISDEILKIPQYGCVNVHASLLPKYRGGAPIHWAIINGEEETGITLMYTEKKMDAGNIILQQKIKIENEDTYKSLLIKLATLSRTILKNNFNKLLSSDLKTIKQDEAQVSFGLNIKKEDEVIDFNKPCVQVYNKIRGLFDKPIAKFNFNHNQYKIYQAATTNIKSNCAPGTISKIDKSGLFVATNDFDICLLMIQAPNKKAMEVKDFINGNKELKIGAILNKD